MNAEQLKKNIYEKVKIRPVAKRLQTATGCVLPDIDDDWMLMPAPPGHVRLDNMRAPHSITLPNDSVREYRATGHLRLACQLTMTEQRVLVEPIWGG